jgi:transcriptional regulator with XRE-family HTH domain
MTLDAYLSIEGNTVAKLAEQAGTTSASIHRILYGEQKPSADMIRAIVDATKRKVSADDLIFGAPRQKPERAA